MSRWFRHYAGMMRDEKLVRAAMRANQPVERVVWVWGAILESAAEINDGGRYDFDPSEAAYFLRSSSDDIMAIIEALSSLERLVSGRVAKWGDRQYQSDNSASRQKAYRDRQKDNKDGDGPLGDGEVTVSDRHDNREVTDASVYISVSDRRTQKEKITDEFQILYDAYPLHKGRGAAQRAHKTARTKVEHGVLLNAIKAFAKKSAGTDPKFIPHPATWLNQERWLDEDLQPPKPQEPVSNGLVYVNYGTDPGDAWERDYRSRGKVPPQDGNGGYYFPSEWPPPRETSTPSP